jgi:hypothetical protein
MIRKNQHFHEVLERLDEDLVIELKMMELLLDQIK